MNKIQIIDTSTHVFPYLVSCRIIYCKTSTQQNENKEKVLLLLLKKSEGAGGKLLPPWALLQIVTGLSEENSHGITDFRADEFHLLSVQVKKTIKKLLRLTLSRVKQRILNI